MRCLGMGSEHIKYKQTDDIFTIFRLVRQLLKITAQAWSLKKEMKYLKRFRKKARMICSLENLIYSKLELFI